MKKVIDLVFGFTSKKPVIFIIIGFWMLVNVLFLPLQLKLKSMSGTMIPDIIPELNAKKLEEIFAAYGPEGMEIYNQVGFYDIFIPLSYALCFGSLIYLLFRKTSLRLLSWVPVIAAIVDYVENYYLEIITADISNIAPEVVSFTGNIINIKLVLLALTVVTILGGLVKKIILKKL